LFLSLIKVFSLQGMQIRMGEKKILKLANKKLKSPVKYIQQVADKVIILVYAAFANEAKELSWLLQLDTEFIISNGVRFARAMTELYRSRNWPLTSPVQFRDAFERRSWAPVKPVTFPNTQPATPPGSEKVEVESDVQTVVKPKEKIETKTKDNKSSRSKRPPPDSPDFRSRLPPIKRLKTSSPLSSPTSSSAFPSSDSFPSSSSSPSSFRFEIPSSSQPNPKPTNNPKPESPPLAQQPTPRFSLFQDLF
jgi:hypothetical protein